MTHQAVTEIIELPGGWQAVSRIKDHVFRAPFRETYEHALADAAEAELAHIVARFGLTDAEGPLLTLAQKHEVVEAALVAFADGLDAGQPFEDLRSVLRDLALAASLRITGRLT